MLDWGLNSGNSNGGSGEKKNFTKFQEGITKIRVLLENGERPHMRWAHWMPQYSRKVTCPGRGCPIDELINTARAAKTEAPYSRAKSFSFNIWNYATNQHEIMEEGITMVEGLLDFFSEYYEEQREEAEAEGLGDTFDPRPINELVVKVRKKKTTSGKTSWTFSLDSESKLTGDEAKAFENRYDFAEYYKPPTVEQVQALLEVSASSKEEYLKAYNEIMGYTTTSTPSESTDEGDIGVEVE